ncbi:MAG: CopD family protein [Tepidisphaeraceae bacterium]|jgi:putative copper export protein
MDDSAPIPVWFVIARAVHFAACMVLLGICLFDRFVAPREQGGERDAWRQIFLVLLAIALPAAAVSGVAWLVYVTMDMSELSYSQAMQGGTISIVLNQTHFGTLWQLRGLLFLGAGICGVLLLFSRQARRRIFPLLVWLTLVFAAPFSMSLAWAGHGQIGSWPGLHLADDCAHLAVVSFWPTGLLPFLLMMFRLRRDPSPAAWTIMAAMTRRFSAISLTSVILLAITGLANGFFIFRQACDIYMTAYGRVLCLKVGLFCAMIVFGAVNLLVLKPGIALPATQEKSARQLRRNCLVELILATAIILAVAVLGRLPPGMMMG